MRISQKKLLDAVMRSTPDGIAIIDKEACFLQINDPAKRILGIESVKKVEGQSIYKLIDNADFNKTISSLLRDATVSQREQIFYFYTNNIFTASFSIIKDRRNKPASLVIVLQDMTELRRLENMMHEFVTNISHEMRTPLTSIKGFVETLLEGAMSDPVICRRFLQVINDEANRLVRMIVNVLESSGSGSSCEQLKIQPVDINFIAQSTIEALRPFAEQHELSFKLSIPDNLPLIPADADKITQVVVNLVDNAIKYSSFRKGRDITISAGLTDKGFLEVCVIDSGIGIPLEAIEHVFERFYRVDRGPLYELGGTGLGLAICKQIIQAHSGEIWVESEVDKGSKFYFSLPVKR